MIVGFILIAHWEVDQSESRLPSYSQKKKMEKIKKIPKTLRQKIYMGNTRISIYELPDGVITFTCNKPFFNKFSKDLKQGWIDNIKYDKKMKKNKNSNKIK